MLQHNELSAICSSKHVPMSWLHSLPPSSPFLSPPNPLRIVCPSLRPAWSTLATPTAMPSTSGSGVSTRGPLRTTGSTSATHGWRVAAKCSTSECEEKGAVPYQLMQSVAQQLRMKIVLLAWEGANGHPRSLDRLQSLSSPQGCLHFEVSSPLPLVPPLPAVGTLMALLW